MKVSDKNVSPAPIKYNKTIDNDKSDIVKGSVDGVITADKIAEEITTILQLEIIFSVEIIPREPSKNCKTGN